MSPSRAAAALRVPEAAPLFAALGDTTRLGLLGRLSEDGRDADEQIARPHQH